MKFCLVMILLISLLETLVQAAIDDPLLGMSALVLTFAVVGLALDIFDWQSWREREPKPKFETLREIRERERRELQARRLRS